MCIFSKLINKFRNKITFHHKAKYGHHQDKIVESRTIKREWQQKALKDCQYKIRDAAPFGARPATAAKCLGIQDLLHEGFVIKSHLDFAVHLSDDNKIAEMNCNFIDGKDPVSLMEPSQLTDYLQPPKGASKHIVRIETPWAFSAPKSVRFLVLPVFYSDDNRFNVVPGILDPLYTKDIHLMLWWFSDKREIVKRGTPLAQLIVIPRNANIAWEMNDIVPEKRTEKINFLVKSNQYKRCPAYGAEFKTLAENLFDN